MVEAVAEVLLRHWDVVGVADLDTSPEVEYVCEAGQILTLLEGGASVTQVEALLRGLAIEMRVPEDRGRDRRAAQAIVEWYLRTIADC